MNYLALYRNQGESLSLQVRSMKQAQELVDLARRGDTLHLVSGLLVGDYRELLQEVQQQLQQGRYKEIR